MRSIVPQGYVCQATAKPLQIDGRLDDPAWKSAAWTRKFIDIEGTRKPRPRFTTRAKMLWDKHYFYIAADMIEPHVAQGVTTGELDQICHSYIVGDLDARLGIIRLTWGGGNLFLRHFTKLRQPVIKV